MKRSPLYSWSVSACGPVIHLLLAWPLQVSKVVRAGEVSEEERRQIFSAIGFSFVNRLLSTSEICGTKTEAWALLDTVYIHSRRGHLGWLGGSECLPETGRHTPGLLYY